MRDVDECALPARRAGWRLLREHPEPRVAAMARHAEHMAGRSVS